MILAAAGIILVLSGKGLKALGVQIQILSSPVAGFGLDQWLNIHIIIGILFLISTILHLTVHYKAFLSYLKGTSRVRLMRKIVCILTAVLFISAAVPGLILFLDDSGKGGNQLGAAGNSNRWSEASTNNQYYAAGQGWGRQFLKKQSEAGTLDGSGEGWGHGNGQGDRKNYAFWHTLSGLLLILAGGWHFYYNWKVFKACFTANLTVKGNSGKNF